MAQNPLKDAFSLEHGFSPDPKLREQLEVIDTARWHQMCAYGIAQAYAFLADGSPYYDGLLKDNLDENILDTVMARHNAQVLIPGIPTVKFRPAHTWTLHVLPAIFHTLQYTETGFYNHNGKPQQAFEMTSDMSREEIELSSRNGRAFIELTKNFIHNGTDVISNIARYPSGIDASALYRTMRMIDLTRYGGLNRPERIDMFTRALDKEIVTMVGEFRQQGGQPFPSLFN